jgi:hypothetical protein
MMVHSSAAHTTSNDILEDLKKSYRKSQKTRRLQPKGVPRT